MKPIFSSYKHVKHIVLSLILLFCINSQNVLGFSFELGSSNLKLKFSTSFNHSDPSHSSIAQLLNLKNGNSTSEAYSFIDAFEFSGEGIIQIGRSVSDSDGNLYLTGGFTGKIEVAEKSYESTQGYDLFIAKINSSNEIVWIRTGKGAQLEDEYFSIDGGSSITIDAENDLYIGGGFVQSLTFTDEQGDTLSTVQSSNLDVLNFELFVVKMDNDGNFLWSMGGESNSEGLENSLSKGRNVVSDIQLDSDGYPYVIGSFSGTNLFGWEVESVGESDIFLASLDKDGSTPFWVSTFGTPGIDCGISISTDELGYLNILTTIGSGIIELPDSDSSWDNDSGSDDTMVMSFDIDGDWYFASFIGAGERISGLDIASTQNGSFYVTGSFTGEASFAGSDIVLETSETIIEGYVVKYDLNGDAIWAKQFGDTFTEGLKVATDSKENVYVLGSFRNNVVFEADSDEPFMLNTSAENDLFIAKYDSEGTFKWVKQLSGSGAKSLDKIESETVPYRTNPIDIFFSEENGGTLYIFGDYNGTMNFDPITLTTEANQTSVFVAKLNVTELGTSTDDIVQNELPFSIQLGQNYPNPFNPSTNIDFQLPKNGEVKIRVFDSLGREVAEIINTHKQAGSYSLNWDATHLSSGMYFYQLAFNGNVTYTKKMTLIK